MKMKIGAESITKILKGAKSVVLARIWNSSLIILIKQKGKNLLAKEVKIQNLHNDVWRVTEELNICLDLLGTDGSLIERVQESAYLEMVIVIGANDIAGSNA